MVKVVEMDTAKRVQVMDEVDCIPDNTNTLEEGINSIILLSDIDK